MSAPRPSSYVSVSPQSSSSTRLPTQKHSYSQPLPQQPFLPHPTSHPGLHHGDAHPLLNTHDPRSSSGPSSSRSEKNRCYDHGCNGREYSTFSNLLRHQREQSGLSNKSHCPQCGADFTRSTARNSHLKTGKCRGRATGRR
jgi:hypothetical protein